MKESPTYYMERIAPVTEAAQALADSLKATLQFFPELMVSSSEAWEAVEMLQRAAANLRGAHAAMEQHLQRYVEE